MTSAFLTCLKYLLEIIFDLFFYSLFQATHFGERPCSAFELSVSPYTQDFHVIAHFLCFDCHFSYSFSDLCDFPMEPSF